MDSPVSNRKSDQINPEDELRVLIAADVLSEGQNLQDARIVVNYDLPWAIIRLIQRAGRVDRIGQLATEILCYSFLPADGVERIINLRSRVVTRLRQNAEVVGADEAFLKTKPPPGPWLTSITKKLASWTVKPTPKLIWLRRRIKSGKTRLTPNPGWRN